MAEIRSSVSTPAGFLPLPWCSPGSAGLARACSLLGRAARGAGTGWLCTKDVQSPVPASPGGTRQHVPAQRPLLAQQSPSPAPSPGRLIGASDGSLAPAGGLQLLIHFPLPSPRDVPPAQTKFLSVFCLWFRPCLKPGLWLEASTFHRPNP